MTKKKPMTASEMGKRRWKGVSKAERKRIAQAGAAKTNAILAEKRALEKKIESGVDNGER